MTTENTGRGNALAPRRAPLLCRGLRWDEVADPDFGEDVARMGGVGLQLVAQPVDVHLQHVALAQVLRTPDVLEQEILREDAPRVLH